MTHYTHVQVQKEGLPLYKGESVHQYLRNLNTAVVTHFTQKLNVVKGKASLYVCEVFQSAVIFEVYKYEEPDPKKSLKYYAVEYKRTEKGAFEFGESQEVERVTRYESVSQVSKSLASMGVPADRLISEE
jgi:hypothetical protein